MRSGTSGFSWTIARGSGRGTSGTCTRPTPSRPRPEDPAVEPELRTDTERPDVRPDNERDRRPDTERRDCEERAERDDDRELERELELPRPEPREPFPPAVIPVGGEPTMPLEETTGARPQVSQYSSPPPTSSYAPVQPGRWHCFRSPAFSSLTFCSLTLHHPYRSREGPLRSCGPPWPAWPGTLGTSKSAAACW
ncbi:hypothetical protein GCM10010094_02770 [Streptomyces flaveus]|uniref:Uncharacterized protein n=1 Tax=Streptomyces flaveus TaxID=66370 RepID=A0A917QFC6_9ACTN|nr:hypothetical protein GCM10010094_02770 [Streptomyces flaveus]